LAVTKMIGGVCLAGMVAEPHPITGLRWVRPVRECSHLLLGDITTAEGQVLHPFDVAELALLRHAPQPPHVEDWITDYVRHRPRVVRKLEGNRRSAFLQKHLDHAPAEVLESQERSLCLLKPEGLTGRFFLDSYTGKFEARITFTLGGKTYTGSHGSAGLPVTDLRWRALGRTWLGREGGIIGFGADDLKQRLGVEELYLAIGLGRPYEGCCWPMVIGVHTVPDPQVTVDYQNL